MINNKEKLSLTNSIENALDVADRNSEEQRIRYTHEEIFRKLRDGIND